MMKIQRLLVEESNEKRIRLYAHQKDAIIAPVRHIGVFGGVGSGKSYVQMLRLFNHLAAFPGTEVIISRQQKIDLERTSWRDFNRAFGPYIKHKNEQKMRITLWNGSIVHFVNAWDPELGVQHLDGYSISAFLIGQAEQTRHEAYRKLIERSRLKDGIFHISGRPIQESDYLRLIEGNPGGKDWIYKEYMKPYLSTVRNKTEKVKGKEQIYKIYSGPDSVMIQVPSNNYHFVPNDYLENISKGSERHIRRYVQGEFDNYAGVVYDNFSENVHLCDPFPIKKELDHNLYRRYIGFDWGLRNPTAAIWMIHNVREDIYYIYREFYITNMVAPDVARKILELSDGEQIHGAFVDPAIRQRSPDSGKAIWDTLNEIWNPEGQPERIPMYAGHNDLEYGIQKVYEQFQVRGGHPGLYIMRDRAPELQIELEKYSYPTDDDENKASTKNLKELPVDKFNHALGSIRYVIASEKPDLRILDPLVPFPKGVERG